MNAIWERTPAFLQKVAGCVVIPLVVSTVLVVLVTACIRQAVTTVQVGLAICISWLTALVLFM